MCVFSWYSFIFYAFVFNLILWNFHNDDTCREHIEHSMQLILLLIMCVYCFASINTMCVLRFCAVLCWLRISILCFQWICSIYFNLVGILSHLRMFVFFVIFIFHFLDIVYLRGLWWWKKIRFFIEWQHVFLTFDVFVRAWVCVWI